MLRLFETYNKAKDIFIRPKMKWFFGKWVKTPGLPVWREGPRLFTYKLIKGGRNNIVESFNHGYKIEWSNEFCSKHSILSKILKPSYKLPLWLRFSAFNYDIMWKYKFDDIRFEFPPQFTIVAFGLALTIIAIPPYNDESDGYWEGILNYVYGTKKLKSIIKTTSYYTDEKNERYWCIRPQFIQPKYLNSYYIAITELKNEMLHKGEINLPV